MPMPAMMPLMAARGWIASFSMAGKAATAHTWTTITDFASGEQLTIWGYKPGVSIFLWQASDGVAGYTGASLHCDLDGNGLIDTSVTFSALTRDQVPNQSYASIEGQDYILFG